MKYKVELYEHLFSIVAEYLFDKDRFNHYSGCKDDTTNEENLDSQKRKVVYEQIEYLYDNSDFITIDSEQLDFTINNPQPDNVALFDKNEISIMVTSQDLEYNESGTMSYSNTSFHFSHYKGMPQNFINEAIELFIKQKIAHIEKDTLLTAINKHTAALTHNKKRI